MHMNNQCIRDAISRLNELPNDVTRNALYREMTNGVLLLAVAQLPEGFDQNGTLLEKNINVSMLTTSMPEGGEAIVAFTDIDSLQARARGAAYIGMHARDVLEMVIEQNFEAIVLNPTGPWATIPRDDVSRILKGLWPN